MNKKRVTVIVCICLMMLMPLMAFAETLNSSGEKTADALIKLGHGYLAGIMLVTDGTNAVTVSVYDGATATGTKLIPDWVVTTSSTDRAQYLQLPGAVQFGTGCFVDITTAGTVAFVVYYK